MIMVIFIPLKEMELNKTKQKNRFGKIEIHGLKP